MPNTNYTEKFFNIKAEYVKSQEICEEKELFIFHVELPVTTHTCPCCGTETRVIKDYRIRKVLLGFQGKIKIIAYYRSRRYSCPSCHKSFSEENPFVGKYQQISKLCKQEIMRSFANICNYTSIAKNFHISIPTVIRYFSAINIVKPTQLPMVLSIDEFKGNAAGQRYQVAINDPESKTTIDILPKRDTTALLRYFSQFSHAQRKEVKYITMDLSKQFRYVMEIMFPHAIIVADRFHTERIVMWAMERVRKAEQSTLANASRMLKRNKALLRKRTDRLTKDELVKLEEIFRISTRLRKAYSLLMAFKKVKLATSMEATQQALHDWLELVKLSSLKEFMPILRSFKTWEAQIIQAYVLSYSNGFTEGINNKIKVLKRISFGLNNFERFRVRILILNAKKE